MQWVVIIHQKKLIDGIIQHHISNINVFYKIFGDEKQINNFIDNKINKSNYEIIHTTNKVSSKIVH